MSDCPCRYDPDHCAICDNDYADLCADPQPISPEWITRLRSVRSGPETTIDWDDCA